MYKRILSFIEYNDLLYIFQFGFTKGFSTSMALTTLVDKIAESLDRNEYTLGVFLDFSKAFDTVNYEIFFEKLEFYGIRGTALEWIKNYLTERKQYVFFNDKASDLLPITCGVPQGSILGPLLFLAYVNDISNVSDVLFPLLFADDTNVFVNGKKIN